MPRDHRDHAEWTPERIAGWAKKSGPQTVALVEAIMASKVHRSRASSGASGSCGSARSTPDRLERASARALRFRTLTYTGVAAILKNNLDQEPLPGDEPQGSLPLHENIRGSRYYLN